MSGQTFLIVGSMTPVDLQNKKVFFFYEIFSNTESPVRFLELLNAIFDFEFSLY